MTRIDVTLFGHYIMERIMIRVVYSISTAALPLRQMDLSSFGCYDGYMHTTGDRKAATSRENKRKCGWSTPQPCEFVDVSITLLVFSIASQKQKLYGWGLFSFQKIGALLVMEGQEGMIEA